MSELLPCPFCGGEAERIDFGVGSGDNEGGSCIACKRCQSSGPVEFGYKENFVSNWNRRAPVQASEARGDWVLVPREPTEAMIVAGFESEPDEFFSPQEVWETYGAMSGCQRAAHRARLCYAAMISAHTQAGPVD